MCCVKSSEAMRDETERNQTEDPSYRCQRFNLCCASCKQDETAEKLTTRVQPAIKKFIDASISHRCACFCNWTI